MKLLTSFICLFLSQAVWSEVLSDDVNRANIDQSPPPFERVHGGDDSEFQPRSPEHQRGSIRQRQDELKFYDAIAENEKDASGNEDALKLIEEKVKEGGKQDPKFVVLLKNPWNKEETIGWGAFQVTEEAVKELMDHPAIMNVTESDKLKKMRSVKRTATTEEEKQSPAKVDKREVDWNQLQWYKDNQAEDSLMAISQWE